MLNFEPNGKRGGSRLVFVPTRSIKKLNASKLLHCLILITPQEVNRYRLSGESVERRSYARRRDFGLGKTPILQKMSDLVTPSVLF